MLTRKDIVSTASLLHENRSFPPAPEVVRRALINAAQFNDLYQRSIREPDKFWLEQAQTLEWFRQPTIACKYTWDTGARKIEHKWFEDGQLNLDFEDEVIAGACITRGGEIVNEGAKRAASQEVTQ